jgi:hypothetical protein
LTQETELNLGEKDPKKAAIWLSVGVMTAYLILAWCIDQKRMQITYYVSQWMVTFATGFVRRGLLGQTVFDLSKWLHIPPVEIIKFCQYCLAIWLAATLGFQCVKNRRWLGIAGVCIVLSNPFLTKYIWMETGSIDIFFILVPAVNRWLARKDPARYMKRAALFMATAGTFVVLSHEAFFFLSLPLNIVITWNALANQNPEGNARTRAAAGVGLIYALPVAASVVAALFHGTHAQVATLEQCWTALHVKVPKESALYYMGFTIPQEFKFVRAVVTLPTFGVWLVDMLVCIAPLPILVMSILKGADHETRAKFGSHCWDYLWLPILCSLPMYCVGSDWDRWPSIPIISGVICLLMEANDEYRFPAGPKMDAAWVGLILVGLMIRPVPANVYFNGIVDGPLDITYRMVRHMPI